MTIFYFSENESSASNTQAIENSLQFTELFLALKRTKTKTELVIHSANRKLKIFFRRTDERCHIPLSTISTIYIANIVISFNRVCVQQWQRKLSIYYREENLAGLVG